MKAIQQFQTINDTLTKNVVPPKIFAIPLVYEDGLIDRDRNKYMRTQELQKKYLELQKKIQILRKNNKL